MESSTRSSIDGTLRILLVLALSLAALALAPAQALPASGRMVPGGDFAASASLSEPLSLADFCRLAVLASRSDPSSGEPADRASANAAAADLLKAASAAAASASGDDYDRAASILEALHARTFGAYRVDQTLVDQVISTGSFNCVSSAIVYLAALKAAGIAGAGVETPDHAFIRVSTSRGWIDAETTTALGFDPGKRKETFTDSFGRVTGFSYVPPAAYAQRTDIGEKSLLALVLHNRINDLERLGRFDLAWGLALDRRALEGEGALPFLRERGLNWAGALVNSGRELDALSLTDRIAAAIGDWPRLDELRSAAVGNRLSKLGSAGDWAAGWAFIDQARAAYGELPAFSDFSSIALNNQAAELANAGRYREAVDSVEAALSAGRVGDQKAARSLEAGMLAAWLVWESRNASFEEGLALASSLRANPLLSADAFARGILAICSAEAQRRVSADSARGWLAAAAAYDRGLALLPGQAELARFRANCLSNQEAVVHNRFASLYNGGRYREAADAARSGLADLPDSAALKRDLEAAQARLPQ